MFALGRWLGAVGLVMAAVGAGCDARQVGDGVAAGASGAVLLAGTEPRQAQERGQAMGLMTIKSEAFEHNRPIPARYTQDGVNVSPPLAWVGLPEGAKELVLIVDDPDAPRKEAYVHWVIYGIPATVKGLPEGVPGKGQLQDPPGVKQGKNSAGEVGYVGPAPPKGHGRHRYYFQLYALDQPLGLEPEAEKSQVMAAMKGRVLAKAQVIGTYERK